MERFDFKRVLPCFLLTAVLLTVPAFAAIEPVVVSCPQCGADIVKNFFLEDCGAYSVFCSSCFFFDEFRNYDVSVAHTWSDAAVAATCTAPGSNRRKCSVCGVVDVISEIPALGHIWTETSRTEATVVAPGSIVYTCSACNETKTEAIPQLPALPTLGESLTLPELLSAMGGIFSTISDWIAAVTASLISHPILLMLVVLGFVGTGAGLFRRLLNL